MTFRERSRPLQVKLSRKVLIVRANSFEPAALALRILFKIVLTETPYRGKSVIYSPFGL